MTTNTNLDLFPATLRAGDISLILGISRASAYELVHTEGFPRLLIGRLILVPKDHFHEWMNHHDNAEMNSASVE